MPALRSCLLEPLWDQFAALLPAREEFAAGHPLGCHRRRIPDRTVFEHVLLALVHGSGYERISSPGCSDRTIRRRVKEWAEQGILLQELGFTGEVARKGVPAPIQAGKRWVVERTRS